jgi:hypothetical protein
MSTLSPDPAEGPDVPPTTSSELADTPATADSADTPATADSADTPAAADSADTPASEDTANAPAAEDSPTAEEQEDLLAAEASAEPPAADELADVLAVQEPPPVAELLITPAAKEPTDIPVAEEPTDVPLMDESVPEYPDGTPVEERPTWSQLSRKPTFGQAVVMITGALLFVWGFLPWYSDAGGSANAWSTETIPGLLLTATWVPLLSLAIVIFTAIKVFADGFPDKILGFTWAQLSMVVGLFDVLISLGFLVANRQLGNLGSLSLGVGLILSFITSLVMLAGAVLDHLGMGAEVFHRLRPEGLRPPADPPRSPR